MILRQSLGAISMSELGSRSVFRTKQLIKSAADSTRKWVVGCRAPTYPIRCCHIRIEREMPTVSSENYSENVRCRSNTVYEILFSFPCLCPRMRDRASRYPRRIATMSA
jgi:hypothetical protein